MPGANRCNRRGGPGGRNGCRPGTKPRRGHPQFRPRARGPPGPVVKSLLPGIGPRHRGDRKFRGHVGTPSRWNFVFFSTATRITGTCRQKWMQEGRWERGRRRDRGCKASARAYDPSSAAEPCDQRMIHHPVTARIRDHGECRCRKAMRM